MVKNPRRVFLSVGSTDDPVQNEFISAVEEELRSNGLEPHTLGKTEWSSDSPLVAIYDRMKSSQGTVVLAMARIRIDEGVDVSKPEHPLVGQVLPTPWNQIEAALAWTLGHPLLVLQERLLVTHGLFEQPFTWSRHVFDVRAGGLDAATRGVIRDWSSKVRNGYKPTVDSGSDLTKLSLVDFVRSVNVGQAIAATAGLFGLIIAAFVAGGR